MKRLVIGIVGSRGYPFPWKVYHAVRRIAERYPHATIVSGGCPRGVDAWVSHAVKLHGLQDRFVEIPVPQEDWDRYGREAGHMRNTKVVEMCDMLLTFWDGKSPGTRDAAQKAWAKGKRVESIVDPIPIPDPDDGDCA